MSHLFRALSITFFLAYFFTFLGCSLNLRNPASTDINTINSNSDLKLEFKANEQKGFYYGVLGRKDKTKHNRYDIKECLFTFEKGTDFHPKDSSDYRFQRFIISHTGSDKFGGISFDSVSYTYSNYKDKFIPLDFSKSFGPLPVKDVVKDDGDASATITFKKHEDGSAEMYFKQTEVYTVENSEFFEPGEVRHFDVTIKFKSFTEKEILLDFTKVRVDKVVSVKSGVKRKTSVIQSDCSDFHSN